MSATAFMPYSIGQSQIESVEEFNTYYDMLAVIGEGIPSAETERVSFDNFVVRGSGVIKFIQEYETAYDSSAEGVALMSSIDLKEAEDAKVAVAIAMASAFESYEYGSLCVGYGIVSAEQASDSSMSASISTESSILFIHSLNIRPKALGSIYQDKPRITAVSEMLSTDGQGFAIDSTASGKSSASGEITIDYSLASKVENVPVAQSSLCAGVTRFNGADSTVAIYRLIEDVNTVVGSASPVSAYVRTLDDWWLFEHIPPVEYETIPKANRIVVGSAQAYNSNYEVVGVGQPLLVNEPVFTLNSTISAFEDYEPSFLRVVLSIANTVTGNMSLFISPETPMVVGVSVISSLITTNNERSRYGGDGIPAALYGEGIYSSPRGSSPDVPQGGGAYIRILGGYFIGASETQGDLTVV